MLDIGVPDKIRTCKPRLGIINSGRLNKLTREIKEKIIFKKILFKLFMTVTQFSGRIIKLFYKVDLNLDIRYGPDFTGLYFILSPLQLSKHFMSAFQLG